MMRQAGRYMPEYRALRKQHDFLTMCHTPELAAEVTLQPIDRLGVDAAILFSDILVPIEAMGCQIDFTPGPVFAEPVRIQEDVDSLKTPDPTTDTGYVMDAIRLIQRELGGRVPLIGFGGAPFTLATYMVEGQGAKNFTALKTLTYENSKTAHALLDRLTVMIIDYLNAQIEAGAEAIQLFDSWVGTLGPTDFDEFAAPYVRRIMEGIDTGGRVPKIYYANGAAALLPRMRELGADVIGVDWRVGLDETRRILGPDIAVQGNLDPCVLFAPPDVIRTHVGRVMDEAGDRPGHIFNLGHGILPTTPVSGAEAMIAAVRERLNPEATDA